MRPFYVLIALLPSLGCQWIGPPPQAHAPPEWPAQDPLVQMASAEAQASTSPSPRIVLHCQSAEADQEQILQELTAERLAMAKRLSLPNSPTPLHIHLFGDGEAYREHVAARYPGFPARRAIFVENEQQLSVFAHVGQHLGEDLRHEAAHGYLHAAVPNLPLWLDEGLAEYFEVGRRRHGLNSAHVELLASHFRVQSWRPNLHALEVLTDGGAMTQLQYAESWLWVHFLLESNNDKSQVLLAYLHDLRSGSASEPLSARLQRRVAEPHAAVLTHLESLAP